MTKRWGWIVPRLLVCLMGASAAVAGAVGDGDTTQFSAFGSESGIVPAAQYSGWFSGGFPPSSDPAQTWTSDQNLATMEYWARLAAEAAGNPDLSPQGIGLNSGPNSEVPLDDAPEPATLGVLGCALALFGFYSGNRARRIRSFRLVPAVIDAQKCDVTLRNSD